MSESLCIDGKQLEFRRIASVDPGAPPIVFLHEGLGSVALWRDFPDKLCARTRLGGIVYSRYGNGFSAALTQSRNANYMHAEALDVLPKLLDALAIEEAVLFGHSDGASIALLFAAQYPERVKALVLEAPHVFVEALSVRSIDAIGQTYRSGGLRERMSRYHRDVDRTFFGWNDIWLAPEFREWNITGALPRITAPVLCIQGRNDEYGTLEQVQAIAEGVSGSLDRIVLDSCGHAPHRDHAAYVESVAAAWIARALSTTDGPDTFQPRDRRQEKR